MPPVLAALLAAALGSGPAPPGAPAPRVETRQVTLRFVDASGAPVTDLSSEEVAILENGVARATLRFEQDDRPLTLAILVDSSQPMASAYRLHLVDAVVQALSRLPEGARYAIWTTGDRPVRAVDFTTDRGLARKALMRTFPTGGNRLLDAIVEVSEALSEKEAARSTMLVVTGTGPGFKDHEPQQVVDLALRQPFTFLALEISELSEPSEGEVSRFDYQFVLQNLAKRSGGRHEAVLSSMAAARGLSDLMSDLGQGYRLIYDALPGAKQRKLEVKVARPGVTARLGQSSRTADP